MLPQEVIDALNAIQAGLGEIPVPILGAILLGGPTLLWLGFRYFVVQARTEATGLASDDVPMYWICERCRSANEVPSSRCYACGTVQAETSGALQLVAGDRLIVVDGVPTVRELAPLDRPLVAVGPGRDPLRAEPGARSVVAAAPDRPAHDEPAAPVEPTPVGRRQRRTVVLGEGGEPVPHRKRPAVSRSGPGPKRGANGSDAER